MPKSCLRTLPKPSFDRDTVHQEIIAILQQQSGKIVSPTRMSREAYLNFLETGQIGYGIGLQPIAAKAVNIRLDCDGDAAVVTVLDETEAVTLEEFTLGSLSIFGASSLLPIISQDVRTKTVLSLTFANAEAVTRTLRLKQAVFYSRTKRELVHKGAESGNFLHLSPNWPISYSRKEGYLIYHVVPGPDGKKSPACHCGAMSCFSRDGITGNLVMDVPLGQKLATLPRMSARVAYSLLSQ